MLPSVKAGKALTCLTVRHAADKEDGESFRATGARDVPINRLERIRVSLATAAP